MSEWPAAPSVLERGVIRTLGVITQHHDLERKFDFLLRIARCRFVDDVYALFRRNRTFFGHTSLLYL
jgi:hypothetical protein